MLREERLKMEKLADQEYYAEELQTSREF
ncbi:hypothetical protein AVEN_228250-1, partial [Araneus ventricosus]